MKARRKEFHFLGHYGQFARFSAGRAASDADDVPTLDLGDVREETFLRLVPLQVCHNLQFDTLAVQDVKHQLATRLPDAMDASCRKR